MTIDETLSELELIETHKAQPIAIPTANSSDVLVFTTSKESSEVKNKYFHNFYVFYKGLKKPKKFLTIGDIGSKDMMVHDIAVKDGQIYAAIGNRIYAGLVSVINRLGTITALAAADKLYDLVLFEPHPFEQEGENFSLIFESFEHELPVNYSRPGFKDIIIFKDKFIAGGDSGTFEIPSDKRINNICVSKLFIYNEKIYGSYYGNRIHDIFSEEEIWSNPKFDMESGRGRVRSIEIHDNKIYICGLFGPGIQIHDLKKGGTKKIFEEMGEIDFLKFMPQHVLMKQI